MTEMICRPFRVGIDDLLAARLGRHPQVGRVALLSAPVSAYKPHHHEGRTHVRPSAFLRSSNRLPLTITYYGLTMSYPTAWVPPSFLAVIICCSPALSGSSVGACNVPKPGLPMAQNSNADIECITPLPVELHVACHRQLFRMPAV